MPEIFQLSPWDLSDLFTDHEGDRIEAALAAIQATADEFERYRGDLRPDLPPAEFFGLVGRLEEITIKAYRLHGFASLKFAENTQNQKAQAVMARIEQFMAGLTNQILFFELWFKKLSDEEADPFLSRAGDLRYWLEEMRRFKPHTLEEPEEKIINIKNLSGVIALNTLYDAMTNRYRFSLTVAGETRELTRGELMVFARHTDPDLRAAAYQELYRVFGADGPVLGLIYQTVVRDWRSEQVDLRKHHHPIAARNLINDIPNEVVEVLLEVCTENVGVFRRYFELKANALGLKSLRRYDLYAPVATADRLYSFSEAVEQVMAAFREFSPAVADLAIKVIKEGHLDSEVRPGKRDGAFCASIIPRLTPWVLINYQGRAHDLATLAHELGHAVHSSLAGHQRVFTFQASLPLAETASTFGEMLLLDRLLAAETDESLRRGLIFGQLDDAYASIMRQAFFALFERQAHDLIHRGATVDELAVAYLENLQRQFGEAVEAAEEFRWEWVSIPHFYHTPFYVYAYSFGQLLVLALYRQYMTEGRAFVPRYLEILSAGGSKAPMEVLASAGLNPRRAEFWQGGFDLLNDLIRKLPLTAREEISVTA